MPLDKLLKEHTLEEISKKTNIAKNNLENLINKEFDKLIRIKALGFISIIEREYILDLEEFRSEVLSYYREHTAERNFKINKPIVDEPKGKSKSFLFFILLLFIGVSWYFVTQFDKKDLSEFLPFKFKDVTKLATFEKEDVVASLSIENVELNGTPLVEIAKEENITEEKNISIDVPLVTPITVEENTTNEKNTTDEEVEANEEVVPPKVVAVEEEVKTEEALVEKNTTEVISTKKKTVTILPVNRLWFGIIDKKTKKRDHFSVAEGYKLDVENKSWLVATSTASFSLIYEGKKTAIKGGKEHYFQIDKEGFELLTKKEYRKKGGWSQW